jgi:hypothetical protein
LVDVLAAVRASGLPDAWVGAGVLRDLVWGELFGPGFRPGEIRDIDVVFYDPTDLSRERDERATEQLTAIRPGLPWEACNQAAVHTWYAKEFGGAAVPPLRSIAEAVATWPETATAVAVRLDGADDIQICAPLGLADLVRGVWRHNPARVSVAYSRQRLARHRPGERWPRIRVVPPA